MTNWNWVLDNLATAQTERANGYKIVRLFSGWSAFIDKPKPGILIRDTLKEFAQQACIEHFQRKVKI
jgi:hypothetical protein